MFDKTSCETNEVPWKGREIKGQLSVIVEGGSLVFEEGPGNPFPD
jgi:hypothetical protein